jgi:hypothetical protein
LWHGEEVRTEDLKLGEALHLGGGEEAKLNVADFFGGDLAADGFFHLWLRMMRGRLLCVGVVGGKVVSVCVCVCREGNGMRDDCGDGGGGVVVEREEEKEIGVGAGGEGRRCLDALRRRAQFFVDVKWLTFCVCVCVGECGVVTAGWVTDDGEGSYM